MTNQNKTTKPSDERFLVNTLYPVGYVTRLRSVAAKDNPRWEGSQLTNLIRGREWEVNVVEHLLYLGLTGVELTPDFCGDEAGNEDIWVNNTHIIEVKSYNYPFTSAADFPFKYVMTNSIRDVNAKHNTALSFGGSLLFVVCSQVTGAMVCTRYKPDEDYNQTRLNNNGVETLVIPKQYWHPLQDLADYVRLNSQQQQQINNPQVVSATHGSNNKHTQLTQVKEVIG